ncbi:hypothetical protein [Comamonas sp. CMM02]|uniref:hypothetical protein n=1 Tax=Comamonas sp. CMM02 TaxID=2769307 RepID=UPI001781A14B|nr:hypothetical protein [Comamonas sp. CMM02]MBD9402103.1 hypothetical protein [Comamonas sp. CMM02]
MEKYRLNKIIVSLLIPLVVGGVAAKFSPLSLWFDMKEGLIAFLGFLAASVIQVMVVTANFLQSDRLKPVEAERLSKELTKQQYFWIGLLLSCVISLVFVIIGSALKSHVGNSTIFDGKTYELTISWSAVVVFFISASVAFVFYKMFTLIFGMLSLHKLRSELVIAAARREAEDNAKIIQNSAQPSSTFVPEGYGSIVEPPKVF